MRSKLAEIWQKQPLYLKSKLASLKLWILHPQMGLFHVFDQIWSFFTFLRFKVWWPKFYLLLQFSRFLAEIWPKCPQCICQQLLGLKFSLFGHFDKILADFLKKMTIFGRKWSFFSKNQPKFYRNDWKVKILILAIVGIHHIAGILAKFQQKTLKTVGGDRI